jgi:hypothetical protein
MELYSVILLKYLTKTPILLPTYDLIGRGLDYRKLLFCASTFFGKNSLGMWGSRFSYLFRWPSAFEGNIYFINQDALCLHQAHLYLCISLFQNLLTIFPNTKVSLSYSFFSSTILLSLDPIVTWFFPSTLQFIFYLFLLFSSSFLSLLP